MDLLTLLDGKTLEARCGCSHPVLDYDSILDPTRVGFLSACSAGATSCRASFVATEKTLLKLVLPY